MSSRVNLNDDTSEKYEFTIGGLDYDFKYPTLEQIEPITDLYNKREQESKKETPESVKTIAKIDEELTTHLYSFVIPVGHNTPIEKTLKTQPYTVVKKFNKMVMDLLSSE